jgi:hypothetical protein
MKRIAVALLVFAAVLVAWFVVSRDPNGQVAAEPARREPVAAERTDPASIAKVEKPPEPDATRDAPAPSTPLAGKAPPPAAPAPTTAVIYGFVHAVEGREGFARAPKVVLTDHLGTRVMSDAQDDGAYSLSGLVPGRYWMYSGSIEDGEARAVVDLGDAEPEKRLDLQLALPPEVLVKVVDTSGEPLKVGTMAVLAVATSAAPGDWFDEVVGSFNNNFGVGHFWQNGYASERLSAAYIGCIKLDVEPPVFVSLLNHQRVLATQRVERGQREVEFAVDLDSPLTKPGRFRMRLLDAATKSPIAKAGVHFNSAGARMAQSDERGVVELDDCSPGWATLLVTSEGFENAERRVRIEPGVDNDLGDVELDKAQWIAGTVVDENGAAVATELRYELLDAATGESFQSGVSYGVKSGADGSFRIGGLSRARYRISRSTAVRPGSTTENPWGLAVITVDTRSGPADNVRLELARGTPLVVHPSIDDWRSVRFKIFRASGERVMRSRLWWPDPQKILLAPGRYDIEVTLGEAGAPKRFPLTVANDPIELALP